MLILLLFLVFLWSVCRSSFGVFSGGLVLCEGFRVFVMCLHGLDILSMWVFFFSLLCVTASAFQHSRLAKGVEFLSRNVWKIHGRVLQEWTRCVFNNF